MYYLACSLVEWLKRLDIRAIALLFGALTFFSTALVALFIYDAMPHIPDERAYLWQAKLFLTGRAWLPMTPNWPHVQLLYILHAGGRIFSLYPPGFPLVLSIGQIFGAPWLVNPVLAGLVVLLSVLLAHRLFDRGVAVVTGALALSSPMMLLHGGCFMSHVAAMFFILLGYYLLIIASDTKHMWTVLGAGLSLGFAFSTRAYSAVILGAPAGMWMVLVILGWSSRLSRRQVLLFIAGSLLGALPWFVYNYLVTGSPIANLYTIWMPTNRPTLGLDKGWEGFLSVLDRGTKNAYGDLLDLAELAMAIPSVGGFSLAPWIALAAILLSFRHRGIAILLLFFLVLNVIGFMFFWSGGRGDFGPRYYAESLPFVWILTAAGLASLAKTLRFPTSISSITLFLLLGIGTWQITSPFLSARRGLQGNTALFRDTISNMGLTDSVVFIPKSRQNAFFSLVWLNDPDLKSSTIFARDLGPNLRYRVLERRPTSRAFVMLPDGTISPLPSDGGKEPGNG